MKFFCVWNVMAVWAVFVLAPLAGVSAHAAEPDVYTLNTSTGAPYATLEKRGFLDLVVKEAFRRIGLKGDVAIYSASKRALINANEDVDQGVAMRVKNLDQKFPNLVRVPERIIENDFVAYARDLQLSTTSWNTLKPYSVAHVHGWVIFERNMPEGQYVTTVKEAKQMFLMLDKKRTDIALYERWQGLQHIKEKGLDVRVLEPPLASVDMYMYMHKKHAHLVDKLDRALKSMKADGTYQAILDETLSPLLPTVETN